jgi:hypothetical protein
VPTRVPTSHNGIRPVVPVSDIEIFSKNKNFINNKNYSSFSKTELLKFLVKNIT